MKKIFLITLAAIIAFNSFSQEKRKLVLYDINVNLNFIGNTSGIDNHFKKIFDDHKKTRLFGAGLGAGLGLNINRRFSTIFDFNFNFSPSFSDMIKGEQYRMLYSGATSLCLEYRFIEQDGYFMTIKSGFGQDQTSFSYSRYSKKEPSYYSVSYTYNNYFVPINLFIGGPISDNTSFGFFIQYNVLAIKGKASYTGLTLKPDSEENIPNVSQNNLMFGIKYRF